MQLPDYHIRLTTKINLSSFWSRKLMPPPENVYLQQSGLIICVDHNSLRFQRRICASDKKCPGCRRFNSNVSSFNGSYVGYIVPAVFLPQRIWTQINGLFGPNMGEYTMDVIRQISEIVTGSGTCKEEAIMLKRILRYMLSLVLGFILLALLLLFVPALWRHWITYPRLEKQVIELSGLRKELLSWFRSTPTGEWCMHTATGRTTVKEPYTT